MILDADGSHLDNGLGVILDVVIDTQIADASLPGSERIGSQGLPVSSRHCRLMTQRLIDGVQLRRTVASRQSSEMVFALGRICESVGHEPSALDTE
jgi:hypothetical protein